MCLTLEMPASLLLPSVVGHGPLKAPLAPLFAVFDTLLGVVDGDIGWHLPAVAQGCLPASLGRVKHGHLITGGEFGGDVVRLLEHVPKEVDVFVFVRARAQSFGSAPTPP
jgi:hypothetical protein